MKHVKENELKFIVEQQIKRKPEGMIRLSIKCPFNYPAVIQVHPFFNKRVFPTIYWLTCPYLVKEISILEENGWIKKMQAMVDSDLKWMKKMEKAHKNYAESRFEILDNEEKEMIKNISDDLYSTLKNSGIGGIKDKKGIKCLHSHLADYLVNRINPVGKTIFSQIGWPQDCNICKEMIKDEKSSN